MRYVLVHPEIGVFLGAVQMPENRIFYWSALSAPEDVTTALLFDNEEQALTACMTTIWLSTSAMTSLKCTRSKSVTTRNSQIWASKSPP